MTPTTSTTETPAETPVAAPADSLLDTPAADLPVAEPVTKTIEPDETFELTSKIVAVVAKVDLANYFANPSLLSQVEQAVRNEAGWRGAVGISVTTAFVEHPKTEGEKPHYVVTGQGTVYSGPATGAPAA